MKKIFFSSLALLVLVLIFLGAYNFAFKNNVNDPSTGEKKSEEEVLGEAIPAPPATAVLNPINENLIGFTTGLEGAVFYYSLDDKAFKRASLEGKDKTVLLSNLPGFIERIVWSPKRDRALVLIRLSSGQSLWHLADMNIKSLVALKAGITRVTWSHLGDRIFYQFTDSNSQERSLNIANPDGSNWRELAKLGTRDSYLSAIPQSSLVSFWSRPNASAESLLERVSAEGQERKELLRGRYGADYLWSPNGEWILVSSSDQKGVGPVALGLMNKNGGEFRSLNIPTLISKTVWSKDSQFVYYALPGKLEGATLPNDYFEKNLLSEDTFWKMDTSTGKSTRLLELKEIGQAFDSIELSLSPQEDMLFFTDRRTNRVYRIDL